MRICFQLAALTLLASLAGAEDGSAALDLRRVTTIRPDASTGRLVRRVVVQPRVVPSVAVKTANPKTPAPTPKLAPDASVNEIIEQAARRYDVDPLLVHSVIQVESGYNKYALSPKGAQGLMQLIPSTARQLGVRNPFDPQENIEAGVKHLKYLQTLFKDDRLALAAYNAGEGAVAKHGWIPPFAETRNYVYQVGKRYGAARRSSDAAKPEASQARPAEPRIEQFIDSEGRLHIRSR